MKLLILLLFPCILSAQPYFNLEGYLFSKGDVKLGGGAIMSFGGVLSKDGKAGIMLGGGAGVLALNEDATYLPVFFEVGFLSGLAKIAPHMSVRIGHAFMENRAVIGKYQIEEGLYTNFKAGVAFKLNFVRLIPYGGISLVKGRVDTDINSGTVGIINFGLMATFHKRK